jgi:hypothetical protein
LKRPSHGAGQWLVTVPVWAQEASVVESVRAEQFYDAGVAAFEAGHFDQAYEKYLQAWGLKKSYRTAAGLGQVELELTSTWRRVCTRSARA